MNLNSPELIAALDALSLSIPDTTHRRESLTLAALRVIDVWRGVKASDEDDRKEKR